MVQLTTQPPEVQNPRADTRLATSVFVNRSFETLAKGLGDVTEEMVEGRNAVRLATLTDQLLRTDHINADLQEDGFDPLTGPELNSLETASTNARKLDALNRQRGNTRRGASRRVATLRQFIAENPRLVDEGLSIFGSAVGRAPGAAIRELEEDQLAKEIAATDPVAIFNQGIEDDWLKMGGNQNADMAVKRETVTKHRQMITAKEQAQAAWETLDANQKVDAAGRRNNWLSNTLPLAVDQVLSEYEGMVFDPNMDQAVRAKEISELQSDFAQWRRQQLFALGPIAGNDPTVNSAFDVIQELVDLKTKELNGDDVTAQINNTKGFVRGMAELNWLSTPILTEGGPATMADAEAAFSMAKDIDFNSMFTSLPGAQQLFSEVEVALAAIGKPKDKWAEWRVNNVPADEQAEGVRVVGSILRGAAAGQFPFTPEQAANVSLSLFEAMPNLDLPEESKLETVRILADSEVADMMAGNADLMRLAFRNYNKYATDTMRTVRDEVAASLGEAPGFFGTGDEFIKTVAPVVVPGVGGDFIVRFESATVENEPVADELSRVHGERLRLLLKAQVNWLGVNPERALEDLIQGTIKLTPKQEEEDNDVLISLQ